MALLPFLVKLANDEKKGITTIGTEREAMDETFGREMAAHPELVESFVDHAELERDHALRADLQEILQALREFCEALDDTTHVAGSDVLLAYLAFYASVKQALERGVAGTDTLEENLDRFFPKRAKNVNPPQA